VIELEIGDENTRTPYMLWSPIKVVETENNIPTVVLILNRKYTIAYLQDDDGAN
jgi:hypothetical protein